MLLGLLALVIVFAFVTFRWVVRRLVLSPARNNPRAFLSQHGIQHERNLVLTIGDSLTRGMVSHDYTKAIAREAQAFGFETLNAGMNSYLSATTLKRIDEVVACHPRIVTILLGTNDVISTFEGRIEEYWRYGLIPRGERPSLESYASNMEKIVERLSQVPDIELILISLPVLGEDLNSRANDLTRSYSEAIKSLAQAKGLQYVALNEEMRNYLERQESGNALEFGKEGTAAVLAPLRNAILRHSWNQISTSYGLQLTVETIHLNERGGDILEKQLLAQLEPILADSCAEI